MTNYKISNLKSDTAANEQAKLKSAVQALSGVKTVTLEPAKNEISIGFDGSAPNHEAMKTAISGAGFTLGAKV